VVAMAMAAAPRFANPLGLFFFGFPLFFSFFFLFEFFFSFFFGGFRFFGFEQDRGRLSR